MVFSKRDVKKVTSWFLLTLFGLAITGTITTWYGKFTRVLKEREEVKAIVFECDNPSSTATTIFRKACNEARPRLETIDPLSEPIIETVSEVFRIVYIGFQWTVETMFNSWPIKIVFFIVASLIVYRIVYGVIDTGREYRDALKFSKAREMEQMREQTVFINIPEDIARPRLLDRKKD